MFSKFFRFHWSDVLPYAVGATLIIAACVVVFERRDSRVLARAIGMTLYPNGMAVVQVPYRRDGAGGEMTIMVDGETMVNTEPAFALKYSNDNYSFRPARPWGERARVSISYNRGYIVERLETEVKIVYAGSDSHSSFDDVEPSIATEAVVALTKHHGFDDKLPADPLTIVQELKDDMRWTTVGGVTPEQYVSGINQWAVKKDVPIRTEKIVGKSFVQLDALSRALANGETAQLYLQFKHSGRVVDGRLVGLNRIISDGKDWYVGIRDTAGPTGTDWYRIRDGALAHYAFSEDTAVIGWSFIQTWNK